MAAILVGLLGPTIELGKCIAAPIKRQFNYLCCFNSNIQSLRAEAGKLDQERTTLQRQVDQVKNNAGEIAPAVGNWMDETETIQAKKREIESAISNVPKGCLRIVYGFPLSKKAKMTAEAMQDLCVRRGHIDPLFLPQPTLASQLPFSSEQPYKLLSRKQIEENVMNELRDQKVNMVGICGMGGIGKTTMAKEIRQRVMKEKLFDETVFVVVSQPTDTSRIQREIAEQLGCTDVKNLESLEGRKNRLSARLSGTKRILIILDDIWVKLKLEDLGIPCGKESKGCTVLLTSRAEDVLKQMDVEVSRMGILPPSEAWSLFKEKAAICEDDHNLLTIAEEVAKECKGLPVSIVTIGSALKGQESPIWKDALDRLKSSDPSNRPRYIEKEVYIPLRVSYDFLEDQDAKSLFLLCCIFPEDFEIKLEDLALYSMGLKMFGGISNMEKARNRIFTVVKKLKSRFLLLDGKTKQHVKMHDVIREVAISIAKQERFVDDTEGGYSDSKWLFLDATGSESFGHLVGSKFPSLQLLIIYGNERNSYRSAEINNFTFLEGMQGLKVLSFKCIVFKSLPQSIELLKNLRTLQLVQCVLNTLSFVGKLSRLEVFQCTYCGRIEEFPLEFGRLNCLKFIDLSGLYLQKIPPGVISNLVGLEELKMAQIFSGSESTKVKGKGEQRRNSSLKELEPLCKLTRLELEFKDITLAQENIILPPKIEKYKILYSDDLGGVSKRKYEKTMALRGIPEESSFGNWIHKLASTAEGLYLEGDGSRNLDLSQSHNTLKELQITNCGMLKELVDTSSSSISINSGASGFFPKLENLSLYNLRDLKQICGGPNQQVSLCNLCEVRIDGCPMLQNLFLLERAKGVLLQLNRLTVKDCEMIERVFILNEESDNRATVTFPKLKSLRLVSLPCLVTFGKGIESMEFPSLETLEVSRCEQLKSLVFPNNWESSHDPIGSGEHEECPHLFCNTKIKLCALKDVRLRYDDVSNLWCRLIPMCFFRRLERLQIANCHNIRSLFTSEMAENLVNLNYLRIEECDRMEQVLFFFKKEENDRKTSGITFPKLKEFYLYHLRSLTSLGKVFESIEFPQLTSLRIEHCPKLTSMVCVMENNGKCDDEEFMPLFCHKKVKVCGLEHLTLTNNNVNSIFCPQFHESFFKTLMELNITECHNIKSLFTSSMVEILVNLRRLSIKKCDAMEEVLRNEKNEDEAKTSQIVFLKMETLVLSELRNLTSMGKGIGNIEFPMLKELEMESCPKLKSMVCPRECNEESAEGCKNDDEPFHILFTGKVKFSKLELLSVKGCHAILGLLSSSASANLTSLIGLYIEGCEHMKKFITCVGNEMHSNSLFPSLKELKIENMPLLEIFLECNAFNLPLFEKTRISGCPQVKFPQVSAAPCHSKLIKPLQLPDLRRWSKVVRLVYINSGAVVVALDSDIFLHLWMWQHNDHNPSGKSSTSIVPQCCAIAFGSLNHDDVKLIEDNVACIALSKDDTYGRITSGGPNISNFGTKTFNVNGTTRFGDNITLTYLAFLSRDGGDVLAMGREDSTIVIDKLEWGSDPELVLKGGHQKRISGLAFSQSLNILVSSGADAHLCVWSIDDQWEKKKSCLLQAPPGHLAPLDGDTRVQFHNDQSHLLVAHQTQIAIYDAQLECLRSWYPTESLSSPVSCATFSCDGQRIFTGFYDGAVGVFDFECLTLQCRIAPSEYVPSDIPSSSNGFPMVIDIASHPFDPNQFSLTNGAVYVIELDDAKIKSGALT